MLEFCKVQRTKNADKNAYEYAYAEAEPAYVYA